MNTRTFRAVAAMAFLLAAPVSLADMPDNPWHPPAKGVVRDPRAAIAIAHAVYLSLNPETDEATNDEKSWQSMMTATLTKGVWQVVQKNGEGTVFNISQRDGRILDIYVVQ
ncbi:MAG TPA: hypothetical protein VL899_12840 [Alphaproteobacteria bacterium]|nr:hypothetical protein [Alphaproteobacteria bacterium]